MIKLILLILPLITWAQTTTELERINLFPLSKAYAIVGYQYQLLNIDTPSSSLNTHEVNNHSNLLNLTYAYKIRPQLFLGTNLFFEQASENGVRYGIPSQSHFSSQGIREPEVFAQWRVRPQKEERGLIDLFFSYSNALGAREIGREGANRLNGRNILRLGIAHGLVEDEWEFRTSLDWHYFGEGEEHNKFTERAYYLRSYYDYVFKFTTQYQTEKAYFVRVGVGFIYRGTQDIHDRSEESRQIQAGTGSIMDFGIKKAVGKNTVLDLKYSFHRNDYFVKGTTSNFDGKERFQSIGLSLIQGL